MERPEGKQARRTVLVVDDEDVVRDMLTMALEGAGFDVLDAEAGDRAIAISQDPGVTLDLVVLDLSLPGMPGEEVHRILRAERDDLPVLMMSGQPPKSLPKGPRDAFLHKPFRIPELTAAVDALLAPPTA